jgi:hypothetical protein
VRSKSKPKERHSQRDIDCRLKDGLFVSESLNENKTLKDKRQDFKNRNAKTQLLPSNFQRSGTLNIVRGDIKKAVEED